MPPEDLVEAAARALGEAETEAKLRAAIDTWGPRFHGILEKNITRGSRPELNMDIVTVPGRGGWTVPRGDSFFVAIGAAGRRERRFTLAHELAHVVLDKARPRPVTVENEEAICELFARRALIPPALGREYLGRVGNPTELEDISGFATRFRVSIRASLVALGELLPGRWPVAFVAASWREHPRADGVCGLRVDVAAGDRRVLFPRHCRLSTLGYERLEASVVKAEVGSTCSGCDHEARPRSRQPGISGWSGSSSWIARRHLVPGSSVEDDEPAALCRIILTDLKPVPLKQKRKSATAVAGSPVRKIPGQLALER